MFFFFRDHTDNGHITVICISVFQTSANNIKQYNNYYRINYLSLLTPSAKCLSALTLSSFNTCVTVKALFCYHNYTHIEATVRLFLSPCLEFFKI